MNGFYRDTPLFGFLSRTHVGGRVKLRGVWFTEMVDVNGGDRVTRLVPGADDGSGDMQQGYDSLERLDDGRIVARRAGREFVVDGFPYVYELAASEPAVESSRAQDPARESGSAADSGAAVVPRQPPLESTPSRSTGKKGKPCTR